MIGKKKIQNIYFYSLINLQMIRFFTVNSYFYVDFLMRGGEKKEKTKNKILVLFFFLFYEFIK